MQRTSYILEYNIMQKQECWLYGIVRTRVRSPTWFTLVSIISVEINCYTKLAAKLSRSHDCAPKLDIALDIHSTKLSFGPESPALPSVTQMSRYNTRGFSALVLHQDIVQTVLLFWFFMSASLFFSSRVILLLIPSKYRPLSNWPAPRGMLGITTQSQNWYYPTKNKSLINDNLLISTRTKLDLKHANDRPVVRCLNSRAWCILDCFNVVCLSVSVKYSVLSTHPKKYMIAL